MPKLILFIFYYLKVIICTGKEAATSRKSIPVMLGRIFSVLPQHPVNLIAYVACLETCHIQAISDQQVPGSILFSYQEHQALVPLLAA